MNSPRKTLFVLIFITLLGLGTEVRAELSLEASLSSLSFSVDQGTMLTITINGASRVSNIEIPKVAGLSFQSRGQSSRINIINGSMTSSLANSYLVQAEKPGIYTIPSIKVSAGGDTAATKPMSFEVTASSQANGSGSSAERSTAEVAFIRIDAIGDHYPGEIVPIRIKAYFNQQYRTDINSLPILHGDGVVMPQLRDKPVQTQERLDGQSYHVLTWETTLSGIKVGKHPLSFSMEASLLSQKRRQSPFGGNLFDDPTLNDPFFDSFFGGAQRKPIEVTSKEISFNVIPLPTDGQPADFSGAIGDFTLKIHATRQDLEVGEPLKLSAEISGSGNFDRVEAPPFPDGPEWKTYTPTSSFVSQGNSYTGTKVFEQAIVAKSDAVKEIPSLAFSYFDPIKKEYITRISAPIAIKLNQSSAISSPQPPRTPAPPPSKTASGPVAVSPTTSTPTANQESGGFAHMAPLNLQTGHFQERIAPIFSKGWYQSLAGLCLFVLLSLSLLQLWRQNLARHPEKQMQKKRHRTLAHDLKEVEETFTAGDSMAFLAAARKAMQNQLGLSWDMPPHAISLAGLKERLGLQSPLIEIFAAADAATYGGASLAREKMQSYLQSIKRELEDLP